MLRNRKNILYFLGLALVILVSFTVFAHPGVASKSSLEGLDKAAGQGFGGQAGSEPDMAIESIPQAVGKIIGVALAFVGLLFFILMIYGGFIWMFARGNDQDVQKAKDLIQAAIIGLIIVLSAYAITSFVGNVLTGEGGGDGTAIEFQ